MIVKTFDNGWGPKFPLKKFEQQLIDQFLANAAADQSRTVVINSVWHTQDYHQQVMTQLRNMQFDCIVLVAMIDAAIPRTEWYQEFGCPVLTVGYYPGRNSLDFWALFVDQFYSHHKISDLVNPERISMPYMCLNRKPHWHRVRLYNQLTHEGVVEKGLVSMGGAGQAVRLLPADCEHDDLAPNATRDQTGLPNDIASIGNLTNWQSHFLNVVTETVYDINRNHFVSEKIFKPIVGLRPFLVYDADGADQWLRDRGFDPYAGDFTDITDLDLRLPENTAPFLKILCEQPESYLRSKFVALMPKLLYNRNQFATYVAEQQDKINQGLQCQI
jgi:hypothetical protein